MLFASLATAWIIAVAVAALIDGPTKPSRQPVASASPFQGQTLSPPAAAPPISLHDYLGHPVSLSQYAQQHKAVLLTFMTSHCPAPCSLASGLSRTLASMPASERGRVQLVAISLDPPGDTRASVAAFLRRHKLAGRLRYLTGSRAQLTPVWTQWNLSAVEAGMTAVYGISASGQAVTTYSALFSSEVLVHDVKLLENL
jgi:protein SCO1/2